MSDEALSNFFGDVALTKTQNKIASYIKEHSDDIYDMSITNLAENCGVGEATISRFCLKLGYKGFYDLKLALMRNAMTYNSGLYAEDSSDSPQDKLLQRYVSAFQSVYNSLDFGEIEQAVKCFETAGKIEFFGIGASYNVAFDACTKFGRVMSNICSFEDTQRQLIAASMMSKNDVAFVISASGATKATVSMAKAAKENEVTVICLTKYKKTPITRYADHLICWDNGMRDEYKEGPSFLEQVNEIFVLDVIFQLFIARNQKKVDEREAKTSEMLMDSVY